MMALHRSINMLSDRALLQVFNHMRLLDLLAIDQICHRWRALQAEACAKRKEITLLVGEQANDMIHNSRFATPRGDHISPGTVMFGAERAFKQTHLPLATLDETTVHWLSNIFPEVTKLEVVQRKQLVCVANQLVALLTAWTNHLTHLKLDCSYCDENDQLRSEAISHQLYRVLKCINSFSKLQYLAFESDNWLQSSNTDTRQVNLPILGRLKEFYFFTEDQASIVLITLQQHGLTNGLLRRIGLASSMTCQLMASFAARVEPQIAKRFCQLSFKEPLLSLTDWERICWRFTSLNKLWITLGSKPTWAQVSRCLVQLNQLVCLRLRINFARAPPELSDELEPVPLPSIRILGLFISSTSHDDLSNLKLAISLPNVQIMDIAFIGRPQCSICALRTSGFDAEQCMQLQLRSLRHFANLRKLYMLYPEPRQLSLDQL